MCSMLDQIHIKHIFCKNPPHFHGVGTFLRFHGIGIFYGTQRTLTCSIQLSSLPRYRNFSTLPWCCNFSTFPWHRNFLWYAMHPIMLNTAFPHFHGVGTFPCFHGIRIFYGMWCTPNCSVQPLLTSTVQESIELEFIDKVWINVVEKVNWIGVLHSNKTIRHPVTFFLVLLVGCTLTHKALNSRQLPAPCTY